MGGGSSKDKALKIDPNEWTAVGNSNGQEILSSNKGNGNGEISIIPLDPKHDIDKELEIYSYRKKKDSPLVRCLGA